MTKSFLFLIGLAVVLGVGLGGAFIGGMAFGKTQSDASANIQSVAAFGSGGQQGAGLGGRNQSGGGFQQGSTTPGLNAQADTGSNSPVQDQPGARGGGDGFGPGSGLTGTVESIEGNTVTIDTPRGPVQATVGENTTITRVVEGTAEDLEVGAQVRVVGEQIEGEEGVTATSILIVPEGSEGQMGRGFSGGRRSQSDQSGQ